MTNLQQILEDNNYKPTDKESYDYLKDVLYYVSVKDDELDSYDLVCLIDSIDDNGAVYEAIDGKVDIYNYDLRQWAVDNYEWIDEAKAAFGYEDADFHKSIQQGQFYKYEQEFYAELSEIRSFLEDLETIERKVA